MVQVREFHGIGKEGSTPNPINQTHEVFGSINGLPYDVTFDNEKDALKEMVRLNVLEIDAELKSLGNEI